MHLGKKWGITTSGTDSLKPEQLVRKVKQLYRRYMGITSVLHDCYMILRYLSASFEQSTMLKNNIIEYALRSITLVASRPKNMHRR